MNNLATFQICIGSNDLESFRLVLLSIADFMTMAVNSQLSWVLLSSVTLVAFIFEVFSRHGDLRTINYGNYLVIILIYSCFFSNTADISLVEYTSIGGSRASGNGETYATVVDMPYVPAYLLSSVYELQYDFDLWIDKAFYQDPSISRYGLMDKVAEYSKLYSGKLQDKSLRDLYCSFVENVLIPDLNNDSGGNADSILRRVNADVLINYMYTGGALPGSIQISDISNHMDEQLYLVKKNNNADVYVFGENSGCNADGSCTITGTESASAFYNNLQNNLNSYYDDEISGFSAQYPDCDITAGYSYLKKIVDNKKNNEGFMPEKQRDFVKMTVLNSLASDIAGMTGNDIFTISETAAQNEFSAANNAAIVKMSLQSTIDIGLLLLTFAFPLIFVLSFVPFFLKILSSYIQAFIVLAFAGPGGYAVEKILDSYAVNNIANSIAGSAAGLSSTVRAGILSVYNTYPWITLTAYGIVAGMIFSLGRGMQILGNISSRMMNGIDHNTSLTMMGNYSMGQQSWGMFSAMGAHIGDRQLWQNSVSGEDMNRGQAFLKYLIDNNDTKNLKMFMDDGAIKNNGGTYKINGNGYQFANDMWKCDSYYDFAGKEKLSLLSGTQIPFSQNAWGIENMENNKQYADNQNLSYYEKNDLGSYYIDSFREMTQVSAAAIFSQGMSGSSEGTFSINAGLGKDFGEIFQLGTELMYKASNGENIDISKNTQEFTLRLNDIVKDTGKYLGSIADDRSILEEIDRRVAIFGNENNGTVLDKKQQAYDESFRAFYDASKNLNSKLGIEKTLSGIGSNNHNINDVYKDEESCMKALESLKDQPVTPAVRGAGDILQNKLKMDEYLIESYKKGTVLPDGSANRDYLTVLCDTARAYALRYGK